MEHKRPAVHLASKGLVDSGGKLLARNACRGCAIAVTTPLRPLRLQIRLGHSVFAMISTATAVVGSMTGLAAMVAAFVRTREQAVPVGLAVTFVLASLGGLFWPLHDLPRAMQMIARRRGDILVDVSDSRRDASWA